MYLAGNSVEKRHKEKIKEPRTEPLAEAQTDRIERIAQLLDRNTRLSRDVPYPGTVKVHEHALGVCPFGDADDFFLGNNRPVQGVFEFDNLSGGAVERGVNSKWCVVWEESR